ncbi:MAG: FHA domain-containing protein [bacterium]|nr:FHA domain-containing protein [bacterium]
MAALLVGSGEGCDVVLEDRHISRQHLEIRRDRAPGRYIVKDLDSTNGTFVAGRRITETTVGLNEVIQIGIRPFEIRNIVAKLLTAPSGARLTIGREPPADLIVPYPDVSARHAEIWTEDGRLLVLDLGSKNGTQVNGVPATSPLEIPTGSNLTLGSYRIPPATIAAWTQQLAMPKAGVDSTAFTATVPTDGEVLLGRAPECDVVVDDPLVSWHHARIVARGGAWEVHDLGSSNGTFVNGDPIRQAVIGAADELALGPVRIRLSGRAGDAIRPHHSAVRLDAINVCREIDTGRERKRILDAVSLSIYPGELVALMGPSGSGKTTLLELLTGQRSPSSGQVLINGYDLEENLDAVRDRMGYVPQEDIMHRDLTVFETIYFTARQRLQLPDGEMRAHVDRLLTRMGLAHVRDSLIGGERIRGISGGQRKRVNIALELVTEPPLIFLDEPTSGLDATAALEVMQILRDLADSGKTIVVTIHQPRREVFELMDKLILLAKNGKLAYFGNSGTAAVEHLSSHGHLPLRPGVNPADYLLDCLEPGKEELRQDPEEWRQAYLQSDTFQTFVKQRQSDLDHYRQSCPQPRRAPRAPGWIQIPGLVARSLIRRRRDRAALWLQLGQAPFIALLIGIIFAGLGPGDASDLVKDKVPAMFLLSAVSMWLGCSNAARELVAERAVFMRERMTGLSTLAYLISSLLPQLLLVTLQTAVLVVITWPWIGLGLETLPAGLCLLFTTSVCGAALGLLVSAAVATEVAAISFVPLLVVPQLMLSGYLKPYGEVRSQPLEHVLALLTPLKWSMLALLKRLDIANGFALSRAPATPAPVDGSPIPPSLSPPDFALAGESLMRNELVLIAFTLTFLILAYARLRAVVGVDGRRSKAHQKTT